MSKKKADGTEVVGGKTKIISGSVTRPANTTAYAAGDQVSNSTTAPVAITFAGVGQYDVQAEANASGVIVSAQLISDAYQATPPQFDLYLFTGATAPTAQADNAAWAITDANTLNLLGKIKFVDWTILNPAANASGNSAVFVENANLPFECGAAVEDIYGLVVNRTVAAWTPLSGTVWTFVLSILQD